MLVQTMTKEDWLNRVYRKSNSERSRGAAKTALSWFEFFCKSQGKTLDEMGQYYHALVDQARPDVQSVCNSLDKFVQFMDQDHDDIKVRNRFKDTTLKRKSPQSIRNYFSFVKSYLRIVSRVRISQEDIKDFVQIYEISANLLGNHQELKLL